MNNKIKIFLCTLSLALSSGYAMENSPHETFRNIYLKASEEDQPQNGHSLNLSAILDSTENHINAAGGVENLPTQDLKVMLWALTNEDPSDTTYHTSSVYGPYASYKNMVEDQLKSKLEMENAWDQYTKGYKNALNPYLFGEMTADSSIIGRYIGGMIKDGANAISRHQLYFNRAEQLKKAIENAIIERNEE